LNKAISEFAASSNPTSAERLAVSCNQPHAEFELSDWTERQLRFLEAENHLARRRTITMIVVLSELSGAPTLGAADESSGTAQYALSKSGGAVTLDCCRHLDSGELAGLTDSARPYSYSSRARKAQINAYHFIDAGKARQWSERPPSGSAQPSALPPHRASTPTPLFSRKLGLHGRILHSLQGWFC
jgi:hypothetical protein